MGREAFTASGFGSESVVPPAPPKSGSKSTPTPQKPPGPVRLPSDPSQQTELLLQALAEARSGDPETLSAVSSQLVEQIREIQHQNEVRGKGGGEA